MSDIHEKLCRLRAVCEVVRVDFMLPKFEPLTAASGVCHEDLMKTSGQLIVIDDEADGEWLDCVYLHEIGHALAAKNGIYATLTGDAHNEYFAALVAIMYRRAGYFWRVSVYDFGNGKEGEGLFDEELPRRFEYVCRRSAELAPLDLTIEQCAELLRVDFLASVRPAKAPLFQYAEIRAGLVGACAALALVALPLLAVL